MEEMHAEFKQWEKDIAYEAETMQTKLGKMQEELETSQRLCREKDD